MITKTITILYITNTIVTDYLVLFNPPCGISVPLSDFGWDKLDVWTLRIVSVRPSILIAGRF